MDVGGILANALGGGAQAVQGMAQGYIEDQRKTDVAKTLSDMEEAKQQRIAQFQANLGRQSAQIERDRVAGMINGATNPNDAADRAMAAGDVGTAEAIAKYQTAGEKMVGFGAQLYDRNGKLIGDNSQARNAAAIMRASNVGGGRGGHDMPEAARIELTDINSELKETQKQLAQAGLNPADPAAQALQQRAAALQLRQYTVLARHGQIKPEDEAEAVLAGNPDRDTMLRRIQQAHRIGADFGQRFEKAIRDSGLLPQAAGPSNVGTDVQRGGEAGFKGSNVSPDDLTNTPSYGSIKPGGAIEEPLKDWVGTGYTWNGQHFDNKEAAYAAAGLPVPPGIVERIREQVKAGRQPGGVRGGGRF